jgi:N-methylhydantoinase A
VNFHLVARGAVAKPGLPRKAVTGKRVEQTILGTRQVDFDADGLHAATIYAGVLLEPGMELAGPAVVQEPMVTLLVPPGNRVTIDEFGSYHVHICQ